MMTRIVTTLLFAAAASTPVQAKLFKCKGPDGKVTYSDESCDKVGAKREKTFSRAELKGNRMRMRPRPGQGGGAAPEFGSGSNYHGEAPQGGAGDPRRDSD